MFGVSPVEGYFLPMTESLEMLVEKLDAEGNFVTAALGIKNPYISTSIGMVFLAIIKHSYSASNNQ